MKFVCIIGVEGSGHGMIRSLLKEWLQQPNVIDQGQWHYPLTELWNLHNNNKNTNKLIEYVKIGINFYKTQGITHLFESASFPFGQPRDALRRPDIQQLQQILEDVGVEYKPLVLYRNPISSTYSGYRRGFTDSLKLQARIIEDNMNYIMCCINHQCKTINFEDFCNYGNLYLEKLGRWFDIPTDTLVRGFYTITDPQTQVPPEIYEKLSQIFTPGKIRKWEKKIIKRLF